MEGETSHEAPETCVPWERLETEHGRLDVQIVASRGIHSRRRLLVVEYDVADEVRLLMAVRGLALRAGQRG